MDNTVFKFFFFYLVIILRGKQILSFDKQQISSAVVGKQTEDKFT